MFYEKPDEEIIQDNTNQYKEEIAKKLYSSMEIRIRKYDMSHQHKTGWKTDQKRNDKGCDMRFEGNKPKVKYFLV